MNKTNIPKNLPLKVRVNLIRKRKMDKIRKRKSGKTKTSKSLQSKAPELKRPFKIYPTEHRLRPIFIQQIDDYVIDYVLNNRKLQQISRRYPLVFAYSGLKHVKEIKQAYSNCVILECDKNCVYEKAVKTFSYLKKRDDYDIVVRTCPDAVILDVDWLLDIADNSDGEFIGFWEKRVKKYGWLRGACNFAKKDLIKRFNFSLITQEDKDYFRKKYSFDRMYYLLAANANADIRHRDDLFEYGEAFNYCGLKPVWHPYRDKMSKEFKARIVRHVNKEYKIALLIPTRERAKVCNKLLQSILETVTDIKNVCVYFGVDCDDPELDSYKDLALKYDFVKIVIIPSTGSFQNLGVLWNYCARESGENILAMIGDDMIFETVGWDFQIIREFEISKIDGFKFVFCHDGFKAKHAVNSFINREYLEVNGYYTREEFRINGIDTWIWDVYKELGRTQFRPDIVIRHNQIKNERAEKDNTFKRMQILEHEKQVQDQYKGLKHERLKEVDRIRNYINEKSN